MLESEIFGNLWLLLLTYWFNWLYTPVSLPLPLFVFSFSRFLSPFLPSWKPLISLLIFSWTYDLFLRLLPSLASCAPKDVNVNHEQYILQPNEENKETVQEYALFLHGNGVITHFWWKHIRNFSENTCIFLFWGFDIIF